ncbi:MAG TPA: hypothetical protein VF278_11790 [Pirellulales bacterium]
MRSHANTLFITTQGAYVTRDHQTLRVKIEGKVRLTVPVGLLPHLQARLLARTLRGDLDDYPALVLK